MAELSRAILALLVCCWPVYPGEDHPLFSIDKEEIPLGESATLTWRWPLATEGYLSSVGMLRSPKGGSTEVRPRETTDYVLVLDAPGVPPTALSRRLIVRGAKGSASDWPQGWFDELPFWRDYNINSQSLPRIVYRTHAVLDAMGEVRPWTKDRDTAVLATAFSQLEDLNTHDESPKRVRRIAYRVELSSSGTSKVIRLHISVAIEWRVVIDRHWFPENPSSSTICQERVAALKKQIIGE
jgi:hypothetical protein